MSDDIKKFAELAGGQYPRGMYPNAIMFYPKELDRFVELIEKAQAARIAKLEAALAGITAWVDSWAGHVGSCSRKNETCTCGRSFILYEARAALAEEK